MLWFEERLESKKWQLWLGAIEMCALPGEPHAWPHLRQVLGLLELSGVVVCCSRQVVKKKSRWEVNFFTVSCVLHNMFGKELTYNSPVIFVFLKYSLTSCCSFGHTDIAVDPQIPSVANSSVREFAIGSP